MAISITPYLSFKTNAREAMGFYHSIFGGELDMTTFGETGHTPDPEFADRIMHAHLRGANHLWLMASDTPPGGTTAEGTSVALTGDDESALRTFWEKLAVGAEIKVPLARSAWGDVFGMLADKFGIIWMINVGECASFAQRAVRTPRTHTSSTNRR